MRAIMVSGSASARILAGYFAGADGAAYTARAIGWVAIERVVLYRECWVHDSMVGLARNTYQDTGGQQSPMVVREACPACGSQPFKQNAHMHTGKPNHPCQVCGRQFVLHADNRVIHEVQCTLGEHLLRENISLRGICRAVGVSTRCLMDFIVACFQALPDHLPVQPIASPRDGILARLEAEADEMWSFVKQKTNKPWVWMAMDQQTRQLIAFHVGDRRRESAKQLWVNLPEVYRTQATF